MRSSEAEKMGAGGFQNGFMILCIACYRFEEFLCFHLLLCFQVVHTPQRRQRARQGFSAWSVYRTEDRMRRCVCMTDMVICLACLSCWSGALFLYFPRFTDQSAAASGTSRWGGDDARRKLLPDQRLRESGTRTCSSTPSMQTPPSSRSSSTTQRIRERKAFAVFRLLYRFTMSTISPSSLLALAAPQQSFHHQTKHTKAPCTCLSSATRQTSSMAFSTRLCIHRHHSSHRTLALPPSQHPRRHPCPYPCMVVAHASSGAPSLEPDRLPREKTQRRDKPHSQTALALPKNAQQRRRHCWS